MDARNGLCYDDWDCTRAQGPFSRNGVGWKQFLHSPLPAKMEMSREFCRIICGREKSADSARTLVATGVWPLMFLSFCHLPVNCSLTESAQKCIIGRHLFNKVRSTTKLSGTEHDGFAGDGTRLASCKGMPRCSGHSSCFVFDRTRFQVLAQRPAIAWGVFLQFSRNILVL